MKETNVKQSHYLSLKHGKMNGTCNRRQEKKIMISYRLSQIFRF
jgi:hypothetical protein